MSNKLYEDKIKKLVPYTSQDYSSIMSDIIKSIPELTPEYNDHSETDMGFVMLEEVAKVADVLSWKVDVMMNESLPGNAKSKRAALIHSQWLSYKPKQNLPSVTKLKFQVLNDGSPVVFDKMKVATGFDLDAIMFETVGVATIDPPEGVEINDIYEVVLDGISGESVEEYLGISNGRANQTYTTTKTPYIYGSMTIQVLNPYTNTITVFTEADYFFDLKNNEDKFVLRFDEYGNGNIQFGDGINGNVPEDGCELLAQFRIGGGSISNVKAGNVSVILKNTDRRIRSVINVNDAYGGEDEETVASINANASRIFSTRNRLVSQEDCIIYGRSLEGVDDAWFEKDTNYVDLYYLYLLPTSRNLTGLPEERKASIKEEVDLLCMLGDEIKIKDPIYKKVSIEVEIVISKMYNQVDLLSNVFDAIKKLLESKLLGETLDVSDLYQLRNEIDGILKVNINKLCLKGDTGVHDIECAKNEAVCFEDDEDITVMVG